MPFMEGFQITIAIIFIFITIIGLTGNIIVLFAIALNKSLHDSTNILIANLALADLLFLTLCPPISAYVYLFGWDFSETLCYITVSLQYLTCYVSVWTLVLLAYDRYLSISCPTRPISIRRGHTVFYACGALWIVAFLVNLPQMRNVGVLAFEHKGKATMVCVDSLTIALEDATVFDARSFYWVFNGLAYLLPLLLSIIFYFLLVKLLWKQKLVQSKSSQRMKRHATRMVFAVILTFGICWLPQNIRFFLRGLNYPNLSFWEYNTKFLITFQSTAQVLAYANSCTNPILYGVLSERFRNGLKMTVQKVFCCVDKHSLLMKRRHSFSLATTIGRKTSYSTSRMTSPDEIKKQLKEKESSYSMLLQPPSTISYQTTIYTDSSTVDDDQVIL
uniref:G-protein coupled receptors family 1 profile domain-containing protein n=1 Tax=Panagrolaimus sp. JU765 TaxID=591449 RepID=A0AC34RCP3_9BILA